MEIEVDISKKYLFAILGLTIVLLSLIIVNAFGTSSPSTFGHSTGEIQNGTLQGDFVFNGSVNILGNLTPQINGDIILPLTNTTNQVNVVLSTNWQQINLQPTPSPSIKSAIIYLAKWQCDNGRIQLRTSSSQKDLGIYFTSASGAQIRGIGTTALIPLENGVFDARMAGGPTSCEIIFRTIGQTS